MRWKHAGTATTTKKSAAKPLKTESPVLIAACNSWLEKDRNNMVQPPGELKMSKLSGCFRRLLSGLELHTSARKGMISAD